jgi:beta-1,2-mannobiose phosphorylase / 1,2-beta-oligomannan phosphorylase
MTVHLERYPGNPILCPNPANPWESLVTTNPGAWYDPEEGRVLLIYRAAGSEEKHSIHLGLAASANGLDFHRLSSRPLISPGADSFSEGCLEDPRVVRMGGYYYITYAFRPLPPGQYWKNGNRADLVSERLPREFPVLYRKNLSQTGLLITKDFIEIYRAGRLTNPLEDDRDVILFPERVGGKYVTFHRPMGRVGPGYGCAYPSMWIAFSDDILEPKQLALFAVGERPWERKIGGACPPIRTERGWLALYHAVGEDGLYRVGAFLLDIDNPSHILCRTPEPILEPREHYELNGFYPGVVFPCGNVVKDRTLLVYYGGADRYVGVASCVLEELLQYLLSSCQT